MAATGDHQGEHRHHQQGRPDPAQAEVAGIQAEHLHRSDAVDRPLDRVQQRSDGPAGEKLQHEGKLQEAGHDDPCHGDQQEPAKAGEAPRQDRADDQAGQDHRDRHGEHRVHRRNRPQKEPGEQHLRPEAAQSGSGSGLAAPGSVGGHPLGAHEAADHPGEHGEGGHRRQPTVPQGVIWQRDGEVYEDGDGPGTPATHRLGESPDTDRPDR